MNQTTYRLQARQFAANILEIGRTLSVDQMMRIPSGQWKAFVAMVADAKVFLRQDTQQMNAGGEGTAPSPVSYAGTDGSTPSPATTTA